MPLEPFDSSRLTELLNQSGTSQSTRQNGIEANAPIELERQSRISTPVRSDPSPVPQQTNQPTPTALIESVRTNTSSRFTSSQQLNHAITNLTNTIEQNTQQQLTAGYQNPGTYLSILV